MFFHTPDIPTLRLCSLMASTAYAVIFFVLWGRRRTETYLLHWGMSSACYAAALLGFEFDMGFPPTLVAGTCYGLIATSDFLLLTGMRRFDRKPPFRAWMAIPIAATVIGVALPLIFAHGQHTGAVASRVTGSATLAICIMICAWAILVGGRREIGLPRRIVGVALIAYLPGYAVSIGLQYWQAYGAGTFALLPMLQDQVLLAVLNLGLLATPWERALRELKDSAGRDALTGSWNRAALKRRDAALALPANSLFLIDIDHFKVINDTFGHAAGDAVLVAFAARIEMLAHARGGLFVRLGGDEFVLVAPTANDVDARALAEQVRRVPDLATAGLPTYSLSVGLARVRKGEIGLSQAMARADRSLYRAKAGGRDQVAA
jgi:diguanylate cyclase (GGDEF)-like protein